jgi:hypothetical protein
MHPQYEEDDPRYDAKTGGKTLIYPENAQDFVAGAVGDEINVINDIPELPWVRGPFVRVTGSVYRADALDALNDGSHELSCGYDCDIVKESGTTPEGERYDCIQTNIVYNHLAIVPRGRAGIAAQLRYDSADVAYQARLFNYKPTHQQPEVIVKKKFTRLDGLTITEDQVELAKAFRSDMEEVAAAMDEVEKKADECMTGMEKKVDADDMQAKLDAMQEKHDAEFGMLKDLLQKLLGSEGDDDEKEIKLDSVDDLEKAKTLFNQRRLDWHKDRKHLEGLAEAHKVEKFDSMDDSTLRRAIYKTVTGKEVRADESEAFLRGFLASQKVESTQRHDSGDDADDIAQHITRSRQQRQDSSDKKSGRERMMASMNYID